jgi:hypothetical protein
MTGETMTAFVLEGPDIAELLGRVRAEHGNRATIVRAERVRSGGIAGFFARQHYEVAVCLSDDDATTSRQAADSATSIEDLICATEQADRLDLSSTLPDQRSSQLESLASSLRQSMQGRQVARAADHGGASTAQSPSTTTTVAALPSSTLPHPPEACTAVDMRAIPHARPPERAGDILVLLGEGVRTLAIAEDIARRHRIPRSRVLLASPDPISPGLTTSRRLEDTAAARERAASMLLMASASVVVIDAPLTMVQSEPGRRWVQDMTQALVPAAVWAVLDATRRDEVNSRWLDAMPHVDAVAAYDDLAHDEQGDATAVAASRGLPLGILT